MNNLIIIAIFLKVTAKLVCAKTVQGVLSSKKARLNNGQYITSFCFYGTVCLIFSCYIVAKIILYSRADY